MHQTDTVMKSWSPTAFLKMHNSTSFGMQGAIVSQFYNDSNDTCSWKNGAIKMLIMNFVCHNRNINYHDNNNLTTTTRSTRNLAFKVDDLKISGRNIFWPKLISNSNLMDFLISRFVQIKLVSSQAEQLGIHFGKIIITRTQYWEDGRRIKHPLVGASLKINHWIFRTQPQDK